MHSIQFKTAAFAAFAVAAATLGATLGNWATASQAAGRPINQLTDEETKAGWKLLFDGKSFAGWHNYKKDGVRPGWEVKDGILVCVDPKKAGDIVTTEKFDWFELLLDYNITSGGNSGIIFHIAEDGGSMWQTGPEIQLLDNVKGADPQRSGWLYQLYKPEIDPKTNKPLDATKPVGEWNTIRVVIAPPPAKSEIDMNGVKYFDFVYNSDDWKERISKSKFAKMASFAKYDSGFIGLQGDHGSISFRNIKIRRIPAAGAKDSGK